MSLNRRIHRRWLVAAGITSAALTAAAVLLTSFGLVLGNAVIAPSDSKAADKLVAGSVCEAQKLKARKEREPSLQIEIPPEYDKSHPSLAACLAQDEAWNEDNPGLRQPIPFSHKHHAGYLKLDCQYCHSGTDRSRAAGVPAVAVCMGCHSQFPPEYDQMVGIQILKKHWEEKKPIEWNQVYRLPEYVKFRHNRHIQFGLACQTCHGPVQTMDRVYVQPDTNWKYLVPSETLQMGWCIQCHRKEEYKGPTDCMVCHH